MKCQKLMDICSNILREYGEEGNYFLGLSVARKYCVRHIAECEDATQQQISRIQNWDEYKGKSVPFSIERKGKPIRKKKKESLLLTGNTREKGGKHLRWKNIGR